MIMGRGQRALKRRRQRSRGRRRGPSRSLALGCIWHSRAGPALDLAVPGAWARRATVGALDLIRRGFARELGGERR